MADFVPAGMENLQDKVNALFAAADRKAAAEGISQEVWALHRPTKVTGSLTDLQNTLANALVAAKRYTGPKDRMSVQGSEADEHNKRTQELIKQEVTKPSKDIIDGVTGSKYGN